MKTTIWTETKRHVLYELLVEDFGPHAKWELATAPSRERRAEYESFCTAFGELVGAKSGLAVRQQIAFAYQDMAGLKNQGMARTAVLNKAAADRMGFIDGSYYPK
jgi:hypothetical protein